MDQKILDFVYSKYQTDFFYRFGSTKHHDNFFARDRQRITKTLLSLPQTAESVLDVGVGPGVIFNYLTLNPEYKDVQGIDISLDRRFVELSPYQNFRLMNLLDLEFDSDSFEMVVCTQVLEHLRTVDEFMCGLSEIRRVCRKILFVTLPLEEPLPLQSDHFHRFDMDSIKQLFPWGEFEIIGTQFRRYAIIVERVT